MPPSPTPEKLRPLKDATGRVLLYRHPNGWAIRPARGGWTAGLNRYEKQARWVFFHTLDEATDWCDEHTDLPEPGSVKPPVLIARKTAPGRVEVVREVGHV